MMAPRMPTVLDDARFRPRVIAMVLAALAALWLFVALTGQPVDSLPPEERRNRAGVHVVLGGMTGALALALVWRLWEIRRKGEVFLDIERDWWRRGEAISGTIRLGFDDGVNEAGIRLMHVNRSTRRIVGDPFQWSAVRTRDGAQALVFRGRVPPDAPTHIPLLLEVEVRATSGVELRSSFPLNIAD